MGDVHAVRDDMWSMPATAERHHGRFAPTLRDDELPGVVGQVLAAVAADAPRSVSGGAFDAAPARIELGCPTAGQICRRLHLRWPELIEVALAPDPQRRLLGGRGSTANTNEFDWPRCRHAIRIVHSRRGGHSPSRFEYGAERRRILHANRGRMRLPNINQVLAHSPDGTWEEVLRRAGLDPDDRPPQVIGSASPRSLDVCLASVATYLRDFLAPGEAANQATYQQFASVTPGAIWDTALVPFGGLQGVLALLAAGTPAGEIDAGGRMRRYAELPEPVAVALARAKTSLLAAVLCEAVDRKVVTSVRLREAVQVGDGTVREVIVRLRRCGALQPAGLKATGLPGPDHERWRCTLSQVPEVVREDAARHYETRPLRRRRDQAWTPLLQSTLEECRDLGEFTASELGERLGGNSHDGMRLLVRLERFGEVERIAVLRDRGAPVLWRVIQ